MSLTIGLDITKQKIDFYCDGKHNVLPNNKKSIEAHFKSIDKASRIVMEATGKYHRVAHRILDEMGFSVMVVNPYQTKHFSKAMNLLCKTDKVDAKMLCSFGETMPFNKTPCVHSKQEEMQDLSRHLDDLKQFKIDLTNRLRESDRFIADSLQDLLDTTNKEIKKTEKELESKVNTDHQLKEKLDLLTSIPGIGIPTALSLLCYLRELGTLSKREVAALSGLAPMNFDSGQQKGKRRIRGGRHDVRKHLYMPILGAATQHNARLITFYNRLVKAGKPKKVALTACMRKLVVWANAILTTGQPWNENIVKPG